MLKDLIEWAIINIILLSALWLIWPWLTAQNVLSVEDRKAIKEMKDRNGW